MKKASADKRELLNICRFLFEALCYAVCSVGQLFDFNDNAFIVFVYGNAKKVEVLCTYNISCFFRVCDGRL